MLAQSNATIKQELEVPVKFLSSASANVRFLISKRVQWFRMYVLLNYVERSILLFVILPRTDTPFISRSQEVGQFQNRLNRAMNLCQDKARDMIKPGYENDPSQVQKAEKVMLQCMSKTVDEHIGLLKPMKQRVVSQIKSIKR